MISTRPSRRAGFTLIELLTVLGILFLLFSLGLPSVQHSREAASRASCANNLRQIGLAMSLHQETYSVFPSNGGWDGLQTIPDVQGNPFTPSTYDRMTNANNLWGIGDPTRSPSDQSGSWAYAILPYLDQGPAYKKPDWNHAVSLFFCSSRRNLPAQKPEDDEYGTYQGGGWVWGKTDYAGNGLVIPNRPDCLPVSRFLDGTSNTILVGEKAIIRPNYSKPTWYWDEPFFLGGSGGTQRFGASVMRDYPTGLTFRDNWGSAHPSGALFLFTDGSVRSMRHGTASPIMRALQTPDGGEITQADPIP